MPERYVFDYAVVRVVPRVDRGEFLNAGVIVFCPTRSYLESRIDLAVVECYLEAIPKVRAGGG